MLLHRVNELFVRGVHTQVMNDESRSPQHHDTQVLTDVMEIAFHRSHYYSSNGVNTGGGQDGFNICHPSFHCACTGEDFRDEDKVLSKLDSNNPHSCDETVIHDFQCCGARVQSGFGQLIHAVIVSVDECWRRCLASQEWFGQMC